MEPLKIYYGKVILKCFDFFTKNNYSVRISNYNTEIVGTPIQRKR